MKSLKLWVLWSYLLSIVFFMNHNSGLTLWMLLELNMLLMIGVIFFSNEDGKLSVQSSSCFYYFLIQSYGSMLLLISLIGIFGISEEVAKNLISISIFIKIGLFPFHKWMVKISKSVDVNSLFLLLTIQKIPLMYIVYTSPSDLMVKLSLISMVMGSTMLTMCNSMSTMIIYSSMYSFIWTMWLFCSSYIWFTLFYVIYSVSVYHCLKIESKMVGVPLIGSFLFFMGLPPFSLFFYKVGIMEWLLTNLSMMESSMFWVLSLIALMGYMKIMMSTMIWKKAKDSWGWLSSGAAFMFMVLFLV